MNQKGRKTLVNSAMALAAGGAAVIAQACTTLPALAAPTGARQPTASTGWRVSASVSVRGRIAVITDVDADSGGDAWAIGASAGGDVSNHTVIEHWTGKAWRRVMLPARLVNRIDRRNDRLGLVGASSSRDVWIFSVKGQYLRRIGGRWASGRLPRQETGDLFPQTVRVFGPDDVWVLGCRARSLISLPSGCHPYAARFNGRNWRVFRLPGRGDPGEVSALSTDDIWTIISRAGEGGPDASAHSQVIHWNGKNWRAAPIQPAVPPGAQLSAITAISDSDVWVGGTAPNSRHGTYELIRRWNGRAWVGVSPAGQRRNAQPFVEDLVPDGTGGVWELAITGSYDEQSRLRHFSHGHWIASTRVGWLLIQIAAVPGTDSTWGVGISKDLTRGVIVLHGRRPR